MSIYLFTWFWSEYFGWINGLISDGHKTVSSKKNNEFILVFVFFAMMKARVDKNTTDLYIAGPGTAGSFALGGG